EERNICFTSDCPGKKSLSGSRRPNKQHAFRNAAAKLLELLRIFQEVDNLVELFLGFVNPGHVLEGGLLLLGRKKTSARFSETQRFVPASLHLLHHEDPEEDQENERTEIEKQADPVGVLHFLIVIENMLILKRLGDIRDGGVSDRYAAEFA